MTKFTSITKQLQRRECKIVMGVTSAGRSKAYKRWKDIDVRVTGGQRFPAREMLPAVMCAARLASSLTISADPPCSVFECKDPHETSAPAEHWCAMEAAQKDYSPRVACGLSIDICGPSQIGMLQTECSAARLQPAVPANLLHTSHDEQEPPVTGRPCTSITAVQMLPMRPRTM